MLLENLRWNSTGAGKASADLLFLWDFKVFKLFKKQMKQGSSHPLENSCSFKSFHIYATGGKVVMIYPGFYCKTAIIMKNSTDNVWSCSEHRELFQEFY